MVLDRFIGARLNHDDPRVRAAAAARLAPQDPALIDTAIADSDPGVRLAAIERLTDLATLDRAAHDDADAANREAAAERLRALLTASASEAPALDERLAFLARRCEPGLAAYLLQHAADSHVRATVLAQVDDEPVLCHVAIHDGAAELRRAALARVHSVPALEEIEHATRTRDRGISRAARARALELRDAQFRHSGAEALCTRMEALAAGEASGLDEAAFHHLEREWNAAGEAAGDDALAARYALARERFRELLARRAQARQARAPLYEQRQGLLAELKAAAEINDELARRSADLLAETQQAWEAQPDTGAAQRFSALGAAIGEELRRLESLHAQARPLRQLMLEVRARLDSGAPLTASRLTALEERARRAPRPDDAALARALDHEIGDLLERLRQKQRRSTDVTAHDIQEIEGLVASMEAALSSGELSAALTHHDEAQRRLHSEGGVTLPPALRQRLQRAAPRLAELRDWQRWGVEQTRTSMCVEVEALVDSAEAPELLARRIRAYREEWQQLDRASATTSKSLWARFDRACTAAYAPCTAHFAAQARARAENLEQKQALLARLDALERDTDWATADLRAAERAFHACEQAWRGIGPVDRALAKDLAGRHATVRAQLEQRFEPRRESEIARRKAIIAELTALAQSDRLSNAAARVKQAQAQWTPAISARRSVERALWSEFRAACDAVFERLRDLRNASTQVTQAAVQSAAELCERAEAVARQLSTPLESDQASISAALEQGRTQFALLRREHEAASPLPPADAKQAAARFRAACNEIDRGLAARRAALGRMEQELCATRARLCRELEQRIVADAADSLSSTVSEARAAWSALPVMRSPASDAMERRFATACAAAESVEERGRLVRSLVDQTEEKRRLCLRVEIVAGVPSPAPHDGARLSYRAQWMQESMRGTSHWPATDREKLEEARRIEARWHGLGALSTAEDEQLEVRYRRALGALRGNDAEAAG